MSEPATIDPHAEVSHEQDGRILSGVGVSKEDLAAHVCACGCGARTTKATKTQASEGLRSGEYRRYVKGHQRKGRTKGYVAMSRRGRSVPIHRVIAERALGKPLPLQAVIHHTDGSKSLDSGLVICQDQRYHMLLHFRMRIRSAGGDPDNDKVCNHCKAVKPKSAFGIKRERIVDGLSAICRECRSKLDAQYSFSKGRVSA